MVTTLSAVFAILGSFRYSNKEERYLQFIIYVDLVPKNFFQPAIREKWKKKKLFN